MKFAASLFAAVGQMLREWLTHSRLPSGKHRTPLSGMCMHLRLATINNLMRSTSNDRRTQDYAYSDAPPPRQTYVTESHRSSRRMGRSERQCYANDMYSRRYHSSSGYGEYEDLNNEHSHHASRRSYHEPGYYDRDFHSRHLYSRSRPDEFDDPEYERWLSRRIDDAHTPFPGSSTYATRRQSSSRSHSPPPIPTEPTSEYIKTASEQSESVQDPPRKLIVLDLNGTLLWRVRSIGAIHPRPYMPSFRDFLLHPETRRWMDVMVWSSAQAHNVQRMVRRCFFDARVGPLPAETENEKDNLQEEEKQNVWDGYLIAVWARDTLDLSKKDYSRKAQTTKNLEKPWAALPGDHGVRTTFLLDDSPRKARLQPFNHICIKEYTSRDHEHDLSVKRKALHAAKTSGSVDGTDPIVGKDRHHTVTSEEEEADVESAADDIKKERKEFFSKKKKRRDILSAAAEQSIKPEKAQVISQSESYDQTLLAMIGIFDAVKKESNVAGWVRAGGLWAGKTTYIAKQNELMLNEPGQRASSPTELAVTAAGDANSVSPASERPVSPNQAKRQRSTGLVTDGGDMKRTKHRMSGEGLYQDETPSSIAPGNDAQTIAEIALDEENPESLPMALANSVKVEKVEDENQKTKMWFEDEETFQVWVRRGRAVLEELGIEERDGICFD